MKKALKILTFIGAAGAAVAGFMYFMDRKNEEEEYFECEPVEDEAEPATEPTYVSLDTSEEEMIEREAADKKSLKEAVKSVAMDMKQKAEDAAKGVGVVAEEVKSKANDFAFKAFDKVTGTADEVEEAVEEATETVETEETTEA